MPPSLTSSAARDEPLVRTPPHIGRLDVEVDQNGGKGQGNADEHVASEENHEGLDGRKRAAFTSPGLLE
jgi:hypothetical protein